MNKFCVFAGTTEGRRLVSFLSGQNCRVTACVATEYGKTLIDPAENLTIRTERLDQTEMEQFFRDEEFDLIVDATHPYAAVVTENIAGACSAVNKEYLRLLRGGSGEVEDAVCVRSIEEAVDFLNQSEGNILLTTGSKELHKYMAIRDFAERVYARVLPMQASLDACENAGVKVSHIIAMQGPFSEEMNIAQLKSISARFLVTKDGGSAGGFEQKVRSARQAGAQLVVIGRPPQKEGLDYAGVVALMEKRYGFKNRPQVVIAGIGPGSDGAMTRDVKEAIASADCLIGARRMLEQPDAGPAVCFEAVAPDKIAGFIHEHPEFPVFTVLMSGDTGFFSGTKKLLPLLSDCDVRVLPGISSLSCLCAAAGLSYEDAVTVSVHGRKYDILPDVRANAKVFVLTGGDADIKEICRRLIAAGLDGVRLYIGERLSYPDEKITSGFPKDLLDGEYAKLSALLIENPDAGVSSAAGLPDDCFIRGEGRKGLIPMTKSEIRAVILSKLRLKKDSVVWDVGAGTGSVTVEMALAASAGEVSAIEKDEDALAVLEKNRDRFCLENVSIVPGTAPEACENLPAPTHVFIGGSSGNIRGILETALKKNPETRFVATAVTLESVAELTGCMAEFEEADAVCIAVSADRKAGRYHLMTAQNPIYVFTLQKKRNSGRGCAKGNGDHS